MLIISTRLDKFFSDQLADLPCHPDTRAYIVGIFAQYRTSDLDLSQHSLTLKFAQARANSDFTIYQRLGDWIFWAHTLAPTSLRFASSDYYRTLARLSYYSCYRLIHGQWRLFEELADTLPILEEQVRQRIPEL